MDGPDLAPTRSPTEGAPVPGPSPSATGTSTDGVSSSASSNGRVPAALAPRHMRPEPTAARWQPLRLGLLNLYKFDDEEFRFAGGRLLLRGNNGTGKSRVLALTLPFLLDGEVGAHRLEPDGDQAKRIEWNLLLGRHDDRLGYTWIEFGRVGDDGPEYVTLGIGMRAVKGRGLAQKWLFTTDRRISTTDQPTTDDDLSLVADAGQALTRDRLQAALDGHGRVFDTAQAYRAEVDRRLFGLGEHRYAALLDLLIELRRPQLSRTMEEDALSDALSEALPPLPRAVIGDVAEAFRTLEADRDQLASFSDAADATATFMERYRQYAAVVVRRRARAVTSTNSDYEGTQRRLRQAEAERGQAQRDLERLTAERDTARDQARTHAEQVRTLETSPAMDRVRELGHARTAAADAAERHDDALREVERATTVVDDRHERVAAAADRLAGSRDVVTSVGERARTAAGTGWTPADHDRALEGVDLAEVRDPEVLATARADVDAVVTRRQEALDHLRGLAREVATVTDAVARSRTERDGAAAQLDAARDDERDAAQARDQSMEEVLDAYRRWVADVVEVAPAAPDELAWELETWRDTGRDRSPLDHAVAGAVGEATTRLAEQQAIATTDGDRLAAERTAVAGERGEVAAAAQLAPPVPHTRDDDARSRRAGAPLWQLVEPRPDVDPAALAGYEAALEAAGLLDAWVTPDGAALSADDLDVALVPGDQPAAVDGGLGAVLGPADDPSAAVGPDVVTAVLARIGHRAPQEHRPVDAGSSGDGPTVGADDGRDHDGTWVSPDGRFRVGPTSGAWSKPEATYLGHVVRERARQRRLAELDEDLAELDRVLARHAERVAELDQRAGRLDDERAAAPSDDPIRTAVATHTAAVRQVASMRARHAEVEAALVRATAGLDQARAALAQAGGDLGLGDVADRLDQLGHQLAAYRTVLAELWPTASSHLQAVAAHDQASADLDDAHASLAHHQRRATAARDHARDTATRRDTLDATVGEEAEQVLARLEQARTDLEAATARRERLEDGRGGAMGAREAAQRGIDDLGEVLDDHAERRADAVERLAAVDAADLLPVADPGLVEVTGDTPGGDWSADRGVRLARRIDQALEATAADDRAWSRVQQGIHNHYADLEHALLPHDLRPSAAITDDLFVVTAPFQGEARSMPDLHGLLVDEVTNRRALLSARERQILQDHLIGDVASHLHHLLRAGEDWVVEVNAELDAMPTSTGMKLRFAWQPRGDLASFPAARRHLLAHQAGWTGEQRDEIGAFLQERITQVRESDPTGTWQHHLEQALDHRSWHRFVVERHQDGHWARLTRRTHGTGSGGEKALALTVPQFAAAAAHYRSAGPHAPRLIMLDEAFVGIDASMRAQCLGLLDHFDLDLVMTSEREWGCYPTVPALAIAQLATRPGIEAVGVSRWVWNGHQRLRADS